MNSTPGTEMEKEAAYTRRWLGGIPYEVAFWRSYYASRRRRADLFSWSLYGKACELEGFDAQGYIASLPAAEPLVVDLGCALSYAMGNIFAAKPATRVRYVDPLAPFYNRILRRYKIDRPPITYGMIENLSGTFAPDTVDLIHVRNALDHCADPMRGIIECLAALRPGGVLYLNHFRDEARRENYRGFHQWNISTSDRMPAPADASTGRLVLWNETERVDVAAILAGAARVETYTTPRDRVVAVITKTGPLPAALHDPAASARRASAMLMATVEHFHSLPRTTSYQLSRLWSTAGHRLTRLLPLRALEPLKALLRTGK